MEERDGERDDGDDAQTLRCLQLCDYVTLDVGEIGNLG